MRVRFLPALLLVAAGCGKDDGPVPVHPVRGQVYYDGKPAAGVKVYLLPTSAPMVPRVPRNPHGVTAADGTFELSTYGNKDGAAEGGYQVSLVWTEAPKDGEEASDHDKLLGWYGPIHSKLTAQVKPGANDLPAFKLAAVGKPPEAVEGVPGRN